MKICGIAAEYNPFHNGHKAMLDKIREVTPDIGIIAVLGSNFTQRGDISVISKSARCEAALKCGVDLVIGMPVTSTAAPAEKFAYGAVTILESTQVTDEMYFGSECGSIEALEKCRRALCDPKVEQNIKLNLATGKTFAKIREEAVEKYFGNEISDILKEPNNTLGIEYMNSIEKLNSKIIPKTVKRVGVSHNGEANGDFASASYIRNHINNAMYFIPPESRYILEREAAAGHCPALFKELEKPMLAMLRTITPERLKSLPDLCEGIENRLTDAILSSKSFDELLESTKTKRYTMARIKRLFLYAVLGITKEDFETPPQYLHVLGATDRGIDILSEISKKSKLPVVTKYSDFADLRGKAKRQLEIECDASNIYSLAFENPFPCGTEITHKFIKV